MKDKIVMKIFNTVEDLEVNIEQLNKQFITEVVKSITGYDFYLTAFYDVFNLLYTLENIFHFEITANANASMRFLISA